MKKLFIISNESVFNYEGNFFCDNLDLKSTPEGLSASFEISILARKSKKIRSHQINLKNINTFNNIFSFLNGIIKTLRDKESKYLIFSISPFTFFACVLLKIFKKNSLVYLRSDGYSEYKSILGFIGPYIYHLMYSVVSRISSLISCRNYILRGKKGELVSPSQLSPVWMENFKKENLEEIKLLYVGRIKVEKGIHSLLEIINDNNSVKLSIVGAEKFLNHKINQKNVNVYGIENNEKKLIKFYDDHNIFVLPSFTEGHPMALLEALSRFRPVIIFKDIEHVVGDKKGIFVAERNSISFFEKVDYIKKNYNKIQEIMKQNQLPTKKMFLEEFEVLISNMR
jgi:glycosyltransferase involved in cell wall biosynthesis|tara:strand:+ start:664 stop:1683 length:1020 start_codon:yes stop_codon:yes gene_type:complete